MVLLASRSVFGTSMSYNISEIFVNCPYIGTIRLPTSNTISYKKKEQWYKHRCRDKDLSLFISCVALNGIIYFGHFLEESSSNFHSLLLQFYYNWSIVQSDQWGIGSSNGISNESKQAMNFLYQ